MAMTVGELVGYLRLDDGGANRTLDAVGKGMSRLESETSSSMASIEGAVSRALASVEQDIAGGLDPTSAIADLDRLERELDAGLASMLDEADAFAAELDRAIDDAFDDLDDKARRGGQDASKGFGEGLGDGGQSRMRGIGGGFMSTLKGLGWAAAGAAIGALIMKGLEGAMDAEDAKAKLVAQLGATAEQSRVLGDAAGKLYSQAYGDSMSDVAEALGAVGSTLVDVSSKSQGELQSLAAKALDLSKIFDLDVNNAVASVGILMKTGMAKDATEAFDLITKGLQGVPAAVREDLLEATDEYAVFFQGLGFSGAEAFGVLNAAAKGGKIQLDKAGDALKEFRIRSVDMSTGSIEAYKTLGMNAEDMAKKILAGGPTAKTAFQQILDGVLSIEDPVLQSNTAVALFGTQFEDLGNIDALAALRPMTNGMKDFKGATEDAGNTLHDTASTKLEAFKRGLQQNVVDFLGGTVLPALEGMGDKFDLSGIGEKVGPIIDKVKGFFSGLFTDIQAWVSEHQGDIQGWIDKIQSGFDAMSSAVSGVLDIIKGLWDLFGEDILNILGILVDTVLGVWNGLWTAIQGVIDVFAGIVTGDWERVWDGVKGIFSGVWDAIKSILSGALELVKVQISKAWNAAKDLTAAAWEALKNAVSTAINNVVDFVKKLPDRILTAVGDLGKLLVKSGKDMITGLWSGIQSMAGWIKEKVTSFFGGLVPDWVKQAIDAHSPSRVFATIGGYVAQGFVEGILREQPRAQMTAKQFAQLIKDAMSVDLKGAPDAFVEWVKKNNSELKDLADKREEIIQRIADAKKYADQLASQMQDFASVANLGLGEGAGAQDMISGLNTKLQQIKQFAADIQKLAKSGLNKTTLQQIIDAGPEKGLSLAEMLVGADGSEIKAINSAQKKIDKVSKQMGKNSADALYDVGKQAGQGFLKGLQGQLKETESMMAKIAKAVVAAAKKELGVKSPSRVFMGIGDNTMAGYIAGVLGKQDATVTAMNSVIGKAVAAAGAASRAVTVPGLVAPSPARMVGPTPAQPYMEEYGADHGQLHSVTPGGSGHYWDFRGAVIREEADIGRLESSLAFQLRERG